MDYSFIYFVHILFGGPLLLYGGYVGKLLSEKHKDETLSGIHLVSGIVHHFSSKGYFMNVTAKKDSFITELIGIEGEKNDKAE